MAGRIPESFIDDVLARTDLVELINGYVHLKRSGKNYSACCPFHQEKTPSFTVSPDKQFYYCFGCGASGNAIGFMMEYTRLGFVESIETLARNLSMEVPKDENNSAPKQDYQPLYKTLEAAAAYFEQQLRNPNQKDRPVTYLKQRGLSGQTAKQFRLGYAPQGWDNLITALGTDDTQIKRLATTGLLVENDKGRRYDRFRDRVMFPIRDSRGRVIAFGGRVLGDDKPKYLNSPETPVFHKGRELYGLYEAKQASNKIQRFVVVEGYMDVIALAQFGIPYAVATLGTATSQEHIEKLFRHSEQLVFCFDGDEAGRRAAWRALENALGTLKDGRQIKILLLDEGEDPDTLVRKNGKDYFEGLMDEAAPLSEYFYQNLSQDIDLNTMDGRARLASLATPYLEKLPSGVFQQLMLKRLSEITQLEDIKLAPTAPKSDTNKAPIPTAAPHDDGGYSSYQDDYYQHLTTTEDPQPPYSDPGDPQSAYSETPYSQAPGPGPKRPTGPKSSKKGQSVGEKSLSIVDSTIRMLLNSPRQAALTQLPEDLAQLQLPHMEVLVDLYGFIRENPELSTASILGHWQNHDHGHTIFKLAASEFLLANDQQNPELEDAIRKLQLQKVEQDLDKIIAEGVKDKERFKQLLELQKQLSS